MDVQALRRELCRVGSDLFWMGLETARSGNLSAMLEDGRAFLITRRGSSLRELDPERDLIAVELDRDIPRDASSEVAVHLAIYRGTPHRAVVHAHPPHAIALSFHTTSIRPIHNEACAVLGEIPVTLSGASEGQGEEPAPIVAALSNRRAMVVRGHGAFCAAEDLETAFYYMGLLEAACQIIYLARQWRLE